MSQGLAIASITLVLKDILENGLVKHAALSSLGNILLTTCPPNQISVGVDDQPQLNLFLYQVTQNRNADWNEGDRSHDNTANGSSQQNHPLDVNLHYILTVYGTKDYQTELLLGSVMDIISQAEIVEKEDIHRALNHCVLMNRAGLLSQAIASTSVEAIVENFTQIQISPDLLSIEKLSRLWSLLSASYYPSLIYQVSITRPCSLSSVKPIISSSDINASSKLRLDRVVASPMTLGHIIPGCDLILYGHSLQGEITKLQFSHRDDLLTPEIIEESRLLLHLPQTFPTGEQQVQVVHQFIGDVPNKQLRSNPVSFQVQPSL